jgi:hypothetical protein
LIALLAQRHGDWSLTWVAIGVCAGVVAFVGFAMRRFDAGRAGQASAIR